jgi:hypothetical protein
VGRLVTTQIAEGLGTLRDIRSSARHEYWFVRHRSASASVVPPYGLYMSSSPILIQPTAAPPWMDITIAVPSGTWVLVTRADAEDVELVLLV